MFKLLFALLVVIFFSAYPVRSTASDTSAELAQMFSTDQSYRASMGSAPTPAQRSAMRVHDKANQDRVLALLRSDSLHSGDDYYYAAMILQHGQTADDYLLAHVLSVAAVQLGSTPARWLSAATFDRLMHSLHRPQVFGTQYSAKTGAPYTMAPFSAGVVPDSLRSLFGVPSLADSERRLQEMNSHGGSL